MNGSGSWSELSTCDSAAKCTTMSHSLTSRSTSARVADVAVHELDLVLDRLQALAVARVGQRVEHDHLVLGVVAHRVVDEVRADEAGGAGDEQLHDASTSRRVRWASEALLPRRQHGRVGAGRAEDRVGGARRGRAELRRGAAVHASTSRPGALEGGHARGPTRCTRRRRRRAGRRGRAPRATVDQRRREMAGVGRAAELVVDDRDLVALGAEPEHRVDEVLAVRAEHPRRADDRVIGAPRPTASSPASLERP